MPKQPVTIKVWCRRDDLQRTANLLSWTVGHRIEIPTDATSLSNTYFFVITDIEQYDDESKVLASMGFDIIGKVAGVIDWEVMLKEYSAADASLHAQEHDETEIALMVMLNDLPIPLSIVQRHNGTYTWKWLNATGQAASRMDAVKDALTHVMKSYSLIRSELIG